VIAMLDKQLDVHVCDAMKFNGSAQPGL